jgi:hypothetical protein
MPKTAKKRKPNPPGNGGTVLPQGKGRPKGSKNKFTNIKDAFINVFKDVGGETYLREFAMAHPKEFVRLMGSMLPKEIQAEVKSDIQISWAAAPSLPEQDVIDVTPSDTPLPANSNKVGKNG